MLLYSFFNWLSTYPIKTYTLTLKDSSYQYIPRLANHEVPVSILSIHSRKRAVITPLLVINIMFQASLHNIAASLNAPTWDSALKLCAYATKVFSTPDTRKKMNALNDILSVTLEVMKLFLHSRDGRS